MSAIVTSLAIWLTFGAAVVLVPISLGLAVLAVRRTPDALRNLVVTLGLAVNELLAVLFVATVGIVCTTRSWGKSQLSCDGRWYLGTRGTKPHPQTGGGTTRHPLQSTISPKRRRPCAEFVPTLRAADAQKIRTSTTPAPTSPIPTSRPALMCFGSNPTQPK